MRLFNTCWASFLAVFLTATPLVSTTLQAQSNVDSIIIATFETVQKLADSIKNEAKRIQEQSKTDNFYLNSQNRPVTVTRFHAKIVLHPKEGFFDVEENYEVLFNMKKHGIYRNIPLVYWIDNSQAGIANEESGGSGFWSQNPQKRRITISEVEVPGHTAKISGGFLSNMLNIRIGDADKYVQGVQKYTIKYRVEDAFLFDENTSYFYWNLMGSQWGFPFLESSFEVHLPGAPEALHYVYTGQRGATTSNANNSYENGVFSGKANEVLGNGKDMTLLLHLPADYIIRPTAFELWWEEYGWVIFPPLAFLFFFIAWYNWGRDKKLVKAVEYFPPEGVDPALAGYLTDEDSDTRDLTALIPYWGAKGLLTMEMEKNSTKKKFKLDSKYIPAVALGGIYFFGIALFMVSCFLSNIFSDIGWTVLGIVGSFLPFIFVAIVIIYKSFRAIGVKDFTLHKKKDLPETAISYEKTMFKGLFDDGDTVTTKDLKEKFYTTLSKAKSELIGHSAGMYFTKYSQRNVIITGVICVLMGIVGGILIGLFMSILGGIVFFLTCIGLCCYAGAMRKRLVKGDEILCKVEGFRMFIKKAKKKELEWVVKENPNYFEETLAYAVAFGFVEKYSKKFEGLEQQPPQWYSGNSTHFTMGEFSNSFHSAMRGAASTLVSKPASSGSSGSGGFSGGGSSGGGFGGGGGGSW